MKIALLTAMLKKGFKEEHSSSKKFFSARNLSGPQEFCLRALQIGLASLVLGGCAGAIPGLHVSAGYDGEAIPTSKQVAVGTVTPDRAIPRELITDSSK